MIKMMKRIFKKRSKLLGLLTIGDNLLALFLLCYFNYLDRLNYAESVIHTTNDLALLIQNMYTSTWWALIILSICLIAAFKLVGFYYRDLKFILISSYLWVLLLILAINIKDNFMNNISVFAIFIPIIIFNFAAYINQKKLNRQVV
jgi:glucan phosphoethanolaminetransferase (alkaline phosphatase superfamily)